jgi:hypothetical protein
MSSAKRTVFHGSYRRCLQSSQQELKQAAHNKCIMLVERNELNSCAFIPEPPSPSHQPQDNALILPRISLKKCFHPASSIHLCPNRHPSYKRASGDLNLLPLTVIQMQGGLACSLLFRGMDWVGLSPVMKPRVARASSDSDKRTNHLPSSRTLTKPSVT